MFGELQFFSVHEFSPENKCAAMHIIRWAGLLDICAVAWFCGTDGTGTGESMRGEFGKTVERGRITTGRYASDPGQPFGCFNLTMGARRLVVIASVGLGWDHVSVSTRNRTPTWDEMCWVKNLFFHPEETVVQFHPAVSKYVNDHPHCLHLWRAHCEFPEPFPLMVGLRPKNGTRPRSGR